MIEYSSKIILLSQFERKFNRVIIDVGCFVRQSSVMFVICRHFCLCGYKKGQSTLVYVSAGIGALDVG